MGCGFAVADGGATCLQWNGPTRLRGNVGPNRVAARCQAGAAPPATVAADRNSGGQQAATLSRRGSLLVSLQAAAAAAVATTALPAAAEEVAVLTVGPGKDYASISEALQAAPVGATVEVYGGRYRERLLITQPVTLTAAPGEVVEVDWQTGEPYQAALECSGVRQAGAVVVRGLRVRHSSPSIANNYAVRLEDCAALLVDCDISSSSGDGVGIEGGSPRLVRCSMHHCARHGAAVFGDLFGEGCRAALEQCSLKDNRMNGLLVRDGATPAVTGCLVSGNGGWGLQLLDAGGAYSGNEIVANSSGSVAYSLLYDEVDTAQMVLQNKLDRRVVSLGKV